MAFDHKTGDFKPFVLHHLRENGEVLLRIFRQIRRIELKRHQHIEPLRLGRFFAFLRRSDTDPARRPHVEGVDIEINQFIGRISRLGKRAARGCKGNGNNRWNEQMAHRQTPLLQFLKLYRI